MDKCEEKGGEDEQQLSISDGGGESSKSKSEKKVVTSADGGGDVQYRFVVEDGKKFLVRLKEQQNGGMLSTRSPLTLMGIEQQGPPQVTQDNVDAGSVKKFLSPEKEAKFDSPLNKVPGTIKNTYSRMTSKEKDGKNEISSVKDKDEKWTSSSSSSSLDFLEAFTKAVASQVSIWSPVASIGVEQQRFKMAAKEKDGKRESSSVKNGDAQNDKKSVSPSSSFHRNLLEALQKAAAAQVKNDKEEKEKRVRERMRRNTAFLKKRHQVAAQPNQQTNQDKETLKKFNFLPQLSFNTKIKMGAKEKCHRVKVNLSVGNGSNAAVKGMEGGRSLVGCSLKRVSTDALGRPGDAKKAKLELERCASDDGTTTVKGKENKVTSILKVDWVSSSPRKTVSWREGEAGIEDVKVFDLCEKEKKGRELYDLAVKLFGRKPQPKEGKPKFFLKSGRS